MVSLWLPRLATDRLCRRRPASTTRRPSVSPPSPAPAEPPATGKPHITVATEGGGTLRLAAVDLAAQAAGLFPGQSLADARALEPGVLVDDADPAGDLAALASFATWCSRYTPWTAVDGLESGGAGGLWLDITGCAHLFAPNESVQDKRGQGKWGRGERGEAALLDNLVRRFAAAGYTTRAGLADTPGAAWAAARFACPASGADFIVPPGKQHDVLAALPIAALRLPAETVAGLDRLGLRRIGDLTALPRASLARRFGEAVTRRLDQALGRIPEPLSPQPPMPSWRVCANFAEPLGEPASVAAAVHRLTEALCDRLATADRGARRLELALYRVGGGSRIDTGGIGTGRVDTVAIGTSWASRDAGHLLRLINEQLDRLPETSPDSSASVEQAIEYLALTAVATEALPAAQTSYIGGAGPASDTTGLEQLIDRLAGRLGAGNVVRFENRESHLPERAQAAVPALGVTGRRAAPPPQSPRPTMPCPRPPRLLPRPEPIAAIAPVPDDPPVLFRWRRHSHRIVRAEGPERLAPEWWRRIPLAASPPGSHTRDYYRAEDGDGRRFWLYREGLYDSGEPPRWYLHGFFG
ncbi:MAG: DNA polymerase Y family protein [Alphaproteobacteria bacterium]|nr:DNA polymerase Y family protein [Alphaproteobacteria bacterium]